MKITICVAALTKSFQATKHIEKLILLHIWKSLLETPALKGLRESQEIQAMPSSNAAMCTKAQCKRVGEVVAPEAWRN